MSGITHEWNGTILTITSDSGTSSADLQGAKGETGIRGPQGAPGTSASVDLSNYYTMEETEAAINDAIGAIEIPEAEVDLSNYYTKEETNTAINDAIGAIEFPEGTTDLSDYYTKTETNAEITKAIEAIEFPETDLSNYYSKDNPPTAAEVGALPNTTVIPSKAADIGAVPTSRKINNKALTSDITLTAADVGARAIDWLPTAEELGITGGSGGVTITKLWENASPTSEFAAQTIALNITQYSLFLIDVATSSDNEKYVYVTGKGSYELSRLFYANSKCYAQKRAAVISNTGFQFDTAYQDSGAHSTIMKPLIIYGIKGVA